jgi:hypothetical protein
MIVMLMMDEMVGVGRSLYIFSPGSNAPVANEAAQPFGVRHRSKEMQSEAAAVSPSPLRLRT